MNENLTPEQLGAKTKAKYPQYASMSDAELGQKVLAKYPQYGKASIGQTKSDKSFRFDVPESEQQRQNKIAKYTDEARIAKEESDKMNSGVGKVKSFLKEFPIISGPATKLGESISKIKSVNRGDADTYASNIEGLTTQMVNLHKQIREKEARGEDASEMKRMYNDLADQSEENKKTLDETVALPSTRKVVGQVGNVALDALSLGTYGAGAKGMKAFELSKGKAPTVVQAGMDALKKPKLFSAKTAKAVGEGAGVGYGFDVTTGLSEDERNRDAFMPGMGTLLGGGLGILGPVFGATAGKAVKTSDAARVAVGKISDPMRDRAVVALENDLKQLFNATKAGNKRVQESLSSGKNPSRYLAERGLKPDMETVGKRVQTNPDVALKSLRENETIPLVSARNELLRQTKEVVPSDAVLTAAKSRINNDSRLIGERGLIEKKVENILKDVVGDGRPMTLSELGELQVKANSYYGDDVDAWRVIGDVIRKIMDEKTEGLAKELNMAIGDSLDARNILEATRGNVAKGGQMTRLFGRTIGAIVGTPFGPAGSIVGQWSGDAIVGLVQELSVSNPVRTAILETLTKNKTLLEKAISTTKELKNKNFLESLVEGPQRLPAPTGQIPEAVNTRIIRAGDPTKIGRNASTIDEAERVSRETGAIKQPEMGKTGGFGDLLRMLGVSDQVTPKTPNLSKNEQMGASKAGYEPYTPADKLPVIQMGTKPKPKSDLPVIDYETGAYVNKKKIPGQENAFGVVAGIEPEYDENGKLVDVKFNAENALAGIIGMTAVQKLNKNKSVIGLTTKILEKLKGRETVSKQFIQDLTNSGDVKQVERDLIRKILKDESGTVNVQNFAQKVETELLPLKMSETNVTKKELGDPDAVFNRREMAEFRESGLRPPQYEHVSLPKDVRGKVKDYKEHIWSSPIKTSAGDIHFDGEPNYFGHTRIEDMADNKTRRVIEVQSDLYQKGNLEREIAPGHTPSNTPKETARVNELQKLQQYNNPTAHFRMIREEVKKSAQDGKTKLQFPTGETAMKIEGLGVSTKWADMDLNVLKKEDLKVGKQIRMDSDNMGDFAEIGNDSWVITDVMDDGKFRAVPKDAVEGEIYEATRVGKNITESEAIDLLKKNNPQFQEQFDISGNIDKQNPIYKFYEKDVSNFLTREFGAKKVTDKNGVSWLEVDVNPELKNKPVQAFGKANIGTLVAGSALLTSILALGNSSNTTNYEAPEREKDKNYIPYDGLANALMELESSGGKDKTNAGKTEMLWLTGLTKVAIDELKRAGKIKGDIDINSEHDVIDASIKYFKLMQERNPKLSPAEVYADKYWTQWKTMPNPKKAREDKMKKFDKLVEDYFNWSSGGEIEKK